MAGLHGDLKPDEEGSKPGGKRKSNRLGKKSKLSMPAKPKKRKCAHEDKDEAEQREAGAAKFKAGKEGDGGGDTRGEQSRKKLKKGAFKAGFTSEREAEGNELEARTETGNNSCELRERAASKREQEADERGHNGEDRQKTLGSSKKKGRKPPLTKKTREGILVEANAETGQMEADTSMALEGPDTGAWGEDERVEIGGNETEMVVAGLVSRPQRDSESPHRSAGGLGAGKDSQPDCRAGSAGAISKEPDSTQADDGTGGAIALALERDLTVRHDQARLQAAEAASTEAGGLVPVGEQAGGGNGGGGVGVDLVARQVAAAEATAAAAAVLLLPGGASGSRDGEVTAEAVNDAVAFLKRRLVGIPKGEGTSCRELTLLPEAEQHERQLEAMLAQTVDHALNHSALLLGPRGCGKTLVVERVLESLQKRFPKRLSPVRLNGRLHGDDRTALKEMARQLCVDQSLAFAKSASFDDNLKFLTDMMRECVLSRRALVFVLDEFDLFAQRPKQCVLYSVLDALHSPVSQAALVGLSCRLDADQLLEKRVRSRFSHRKFVFLPPPLDDGIRLLEQSLALPENPTPAFRHTGYAARFNRSLANLFRGTEMRKLLERYTGVNRSPRHLLDLGFRALCAMDRTRGALSLADFQAAHRAQSQQPKMLLLRDVSVLELFLLVAMKRLEGKDLDAYNFQMVFAEYERCKAMMVGTVDMYSRAAALRGFEQLVRRELVAFTESRRERSALQEYRTVRLLVDPRELSQALQTHASCPEILKQWFSRESIARAALDM